jgi:hypothetical protein
MADLDSELNDLSFSGEPGNDFTDLWKSDNAATADEQQALDESAAPGIIPPSTPNFGRIAPPEIVPTGIPSGISRQTKIPRPETQAGIIPVEPGSMHFTNIQPEGFVGAPPATGNVAENIKFEPAVVPTIQPTPSIFAPGPRLPVEGQVVPNLESKIEPPIPKELTQDESIADQLNKIRNTTIFQAGDTKDTQDVLSQLWSPSYQEKMPTEGPVPFNKDDPHSWVKDAKFKTGAQLVSEATGEIPVQKTWLREKLGQPLYFKWLERPPRVI